MDVNWQRNQKFLILFELMLRNADAIFMTFKGKIRWMLYNSRNIGSLKGYYFRFMLS